MRGRRCLWAFARRSNGRRGLAMTQEGPAERMEKRGEMYQGTVYCMTGGRCRPVCCQILCSRRMPLLKYAASPAAGAEVATSVR